ncbi:unnamed protein product [Caenorhabditis angaria]|uniref:Reverse transcriptase domain-containing protein n=1 Tax=Caenorhabditis angaria TaxID=860376 RepID=A0A9P1N787_9PELO|nr:unnamed protein product [Caenorhabditis angaria]
MVNARASPPSDARQQCPTGVKNMRGQNCIRIASLNVGTMTGRSLEIAQELEKRSIDIAAVQETRWKGSKSRDIGHGYKLIYHGATAHNGVGIIISDKLRDCVAEVDRISDRIISVELDIDDQNLKIYSVYAPQTGCPETEKDIFWNQLADCTQDTSQNLLICGDLNGHVGQTSNGYDCHGGKGYGNVNDDGNRILDFAECRNLKIANTFFTKRPAHLITYNSGGHNTQIDYILANPSKVKIHDCKVIPSANVTTQHRILIADTLLKLPRKSKPKMVSVKRIKWWKLKENSQVFKNEMILPSLNTNVETIWINLKKNVTELAERTIGTTKPGRKFHDKKCWMWTDEVKTAVQKKKYCFKAYKNAPNDANLLEYQNAKRLAKIEIAKRRDEYQDDIYEQLEASRSAKTADKAIFQLAQMRHRKSLDIEKYRCIENKNGSKLTKTDEILIRWKEHFEEISNVEFPHQPANSAKRTMPDSFIPITEPETHAAISKMKNGKSTGPDDISAEMWKLLGVEGLKWLTAFLNKVCETKSFPEDWKTSSTIPVFKMKGTPADCANYRPIRLLCHTMKILERIVDTRIRKIVKISNQQCGFVKGKSTTDAIFAARQIIEKHREKKSPLHLAFLDLEKGL